MRKLGMRLRNSYLGIHKWFIFFIFFIAMHIRVDDLSIRLSVHSGTDDLCIYDMYDDLFVQMGGAYITSKNVKKEFKFVQKKDSKRKLFPERL
jgi:hypothetical protein